VPLALVTGAADLLGSVGAALSRAGFDVVTGETPPPPSAGPFDCYVQLPCAAGRANRDLVCRIDALAAVAARLGPDASVILGVDGAADLLAAVALALLEDLGRPSTRLVVLPVEDLCRPAAPVPVDAQWEPVRRDVIGVS
jgi:hypothetical protein